MQYNVDTPEDYLNALKQDWRKETLKELRALILKQMYTIQELIHYKMLGYKLNNKFILHLNVQKNYVSLYVGDTKKIDADGLLLQGLSTGKGCIRFSKTQTINETKIEKFIEKTIQLSKVNIDTGC